MTIELSLRALADNFPVSAELLPVHARRFNELFKTRWERIVDFLKLHYALSERTEPYWEAHRQAASRSNRLEELLTLWRSQPPSSYDFPMIEELFPAASYQYVLYGMSGRPTDRSAAPIDLAPLASVNNRTRALLAALPTNRDYLEPLRPATVQPDRIVH